MRDISTDRYSTSVASSMLESSVFLSACLVGWVIFTVLLLVGAVLLFVYALIAETLSSALAAPSRLGTDAAREAAERLCRIP